MEQQAGGYKAEALAVAHFAVVHRIGLGDLEERILARAARLLEAFVRRKSAMDVPLNDCLAFGFL